MNELIERIEAFYGRYSEAKLDDLAGIYLPGANFRDPVHSMQGLQAISDYFEAGRKGLLECQFTFSNRLIQGTQLVLEWRMDFAHKRLNKGRLISVDGCSVLELEPSLTRVSRHRDYFDMGAMVYEHVPLLGSVTRRVKSRLAKT